MKKEQIIMKLLIDNADIRKIEEAYSIFPLEGVTTNPTILAAAGRPPGVRPPRRTT